MKRIIRQGVVVGLALAISGVPASIAFAEESTPTVNGTETVPFSDPCTDIEPGAASMEPQEIESEVHDQDQRAWIESIWESP